jgi:hypothetical protein
MRFTEYAERGDVKRGLPRRFELSAARLARATVHVSAESYRIEIVRSRAHEARDGSGIRIYLSFLCRRSIELSHVIAETLYATRINLRAFSVANRRVDPLRQFGH